MPLPTRTVINTPDCLCLASSKWPSTSASHVCLSAQLLKALELPLASACLPLFDHQRSLLARFILHAPLCVGKAAHVG
eukprot:scaffold267578_cov13-Tisochrysis_lutea.AAC.1